QIMDSIMEEEIYFDMEDEEKGPGTGTTGLYFGPNAPLDAALQGGNQAVAGIYIKYRFFFKKKIMFFYITTPVRMREASKVDRSAGSISTTRTYPSALHEVTAKWIRVQRLRDGLFYIIKYIIVFSRKISNSFFFFAFSLLWGPLFLLIFVSIIPAYGLNTRQMYFKVTTLARVDALLMSANNGRCYDQDESAKKKGGGGGGGTG
ncbi:hypothetical protein ACJX0J_026188, partial [Zea mays]